MSRKDFVAVAAAIKSVSSSISAEGDDSLLSPQTPAQTVEVLAGALADVFSQANPRFDRNRFLAACGVIGGAK